jgi:hypothetical protein
LPTRYFGSFTNSYLSACPSVCLSVLSTCLFICQIVCLFICILDCLSVKLLFFSGHPFVLKIKVKRQWLPNFCLRLAHFNLSSSINS